MATRARLKFVKKDEKKYLQSLIIAPKLNSSNINKASPTLISVNGETQF